MNVHSMTSENRYARARGGEAYSTDPYLDLYLLVVRHFYPATGTIVKHIVRVSCRYVPPKIRLISKECSVVCTYAFLYLQENPQDAAQLNSKRSKTMRAYVYCIYFDCTSIIQPVEIVSPQAVHIDQSFLTIFFFKNSLL